jgi:hypothetical protein
MGGFRCWLHSGPNSNSSVQCDGPDEAEMIFEELLRSQDRTFRCGFYGYLLKFTICKRKFDCFKFPCAQNIFDR